MRKRKSLEFLTAEAQRARRFSDLKGSAPRKSPCLCVSVVKNLCELRLRSTSSELYRTAILIAFSGGFGKQTMQAPDRLEPRAVPCRTLRAGLTQQNGAAQCMPELLLA
jgi:hypothetical protein